MKSSEHKNFDFEDLHNLKNMDMEGLHKAVKSGKVDNLINRLDQIAQHPESLKKLTNLMIEVDSSAPIRHFRKFWDKLPHLAQWATMHISKGFLVMSSTHGPIELMIKNGFIVYKGHLNENGQIMEEKIQALGGMDKYMLKYGVKIGKYFAPELAAVEPFIDPLLKLQDVGDKTMEKVRHGVRAAREAREAPEHNIANISNATRSNLQTLSLLPADFAHDL